MILSGYICDICFQRFENSEETKYWSNTLTPHTLKHRGLSRYYVGDGIPPNAEQCDMCDACYKEVTNFIESKLGGKIRNKK